MKKLIMLFAFFGVFTLTAQAQSCAKTCAKSCKKGKTTTTAAVGGIDDIQIAKMASLQGNIERRECQKSGTVSYFQKNTCAKSGKVSFAEVTYDAKEAKFVNVSPSDMGAADVDAAKSMEASGTMSTAKKAACAKGKKACCAKGKKVTSREKVSEIKPVATQVSNQ